MSSGALARFVTGAALFAAIAGTTACNGSSPSAPCTCAEADAPPPVDAALMAYLSKARSLHHQADQREDAGDVPQAIAPLERLVSTPVPGGANALPEAREVLADTFARLGELRGRTGAFDDAERDIQRGLERAPKDSYFEGHLFEQRGVNEERRAKSLATEGDATGAEAARKRAFDAFERAVAIQDRVILRELSRDGGDR
jgi:tetratricopeptide (TPR) repeat protein